MVGACDKVDVDVLEPTTVWVVTVTKAMSFSHDTLDGYRCEPLHPLPLPAALASSLASAEASRFFMALYPDAASCDSSGVNPANGATVEVDVTVVVVVVVVELHSY